ncbi:hypothetical protein RhiirA5_373005 [Rhizophagus irregularis]|uniref:Uncharacterized protein n=1 Tax=Rhizophagus irregularis TaxID=588596 RepID=A0A2N0Q0D0_9GLOM|nr:hypothetical protein RhiirA5_373005 [Rhizophagus irregularis]
MSSVQITVFPEGRESIRYLVVQSRAATRYPFTRTQSGYTRVSMMYPGYGIANGFIEKKPGFYPVIPGYTRVISNKKDKRSIEEDKATNEINDSPSLESSEEMTTDTLLLRIFKKLITEKHEPKTTRLPEAHHDVSRKLSSSSVISSSSVLIVTGKIMTSDNYDDCNDCMVQDEEK